MVWLMVNLRQKNSQENIRKRIKMRVKPPKETAPATWTEAVERFLTRLKDRRKSDKTIRCYREELAAYAAWSEDAFKEPPSLEAIMESDLREWIAWLRAQKSPKLKPATINKKRAALKSFLRWSEVKGFSDPVEMPPPMKGQPGALRWLSKNDEHALIRAVNKKRNLADRTSSDGQNHLRDRTLIMFFLRVGPRIEEVSKLCKGDLELREHKGWATLAGKGDKPRRVPIENETVKLLNELVPTLKRTDKDPDVHVFRGQRGPLSVSALHRIVVDYAKLAKLPPGISAHNLRHTFGKRTYDRTKDLATLQQLLGHASIATTALYAKAGEEDLERAVADRAGVADSDD
jgi:site-specific recombinase XerD